LNEEALILSLQKEQNADSSVEEIKDEDVSCRTISDLDVMATYKILIYLQQIFNQCGAPAAAGSNARLEMMCASRLASMLLLLLTHIKLLWMNLL